MVYTLHLDSIAVILLIQHLKTYNYSPHKTPLVRYSRILIFASVLEKSSLSHSKKVRNLRGLVISVKQKAISNI